MKVLLLAYGTRGDVQPFVALGQALQGRGHAVALAAPARFETFVLRHKLDFCPISDEMLAILDTPQGKQIIERTRSILDSLVQNLRFAARIQPMLIQQLEDCWRAAQRVKPDAIIFHPKGFAGPTLAEYFNCPAVIALTFPMLVPTREQPHIGFPKLALGPKYNRWTHGFVNFMATRAMKRPLKQLRSMLGLPEAKQYGLLHTAQGVRLPSLTAVSPTIVPQPGDWGANDRMIGYWYLEDELPPSDELVAFIESGPDPVYIGFGSMAGRDPLRLTHAAIEALRALGQRGILATGWGGLTHVSTDESVLTIADAPHHWLFARTAAIVHHGGAGTTAAALRSGVPSIIVPFMGDQPYWADRVHALRAGPAKIPQKRLTKDSLAIAIQTALNDNRMRSEAAALGAKLRAEDGLGNACALIENLLR